MNGLGPASKSLPGSRVSLIICKGLSDNWSPVRYAASVAVRSFLIANTDTKTEYYPVLLPAMCLNRLYVAEGVKLYSQQTWREVVGMQGKELVCEHMQNVVAHYIQAAEAQNHAVREAAFAGMEELAIRVDRVAVAPWVGRILEAIEKSYATGTWASFLFFACAF
jgi:hypothetical protein